MWQKVKTMEAKLLLGFFSEKAVATDFDRKIEFKQKARDSFVKYVWETQL